LGKQVEGNVRTDYDTAGHLICLLFHRNKRQSLKKSPTVKCRNYSFNY